MARGMTPKFRSSADRASTTSTACGYSTSHEASSSGLICWTIGNSLASAPALLLSSARRDRFRAFCSTLAYPPPPLPLPLPLVTWLPLAMDEEARGAAAPHAPLITGELEAAAAAAAAAAAEEFAGSGMP